MKLIEQELNVLSSSEIRVALLPVGAVPEGALRDYEALVQKYRHVRLSTVRSFHHEKQKSPFKYLPWNKGCLNFKFLTGTLLQPSSLSCLYASRAVLGVIGLCHCPSSPDIPKAYAEFEKMCKQFPNSVTVRCFAFEPVDDEMSQNGRQKEHLIMFPKCSPTELEHNVEVFMHDFAAYLLMELQRGMLNLSVGMMSLTTVLDQPEIFGYGNVTDEITKRLGTEEEVRLRRRHTRMQKLFGDWSMLAGSPRDAYEHYNTCVELSRYCGDAVWGAAAVEGMAEAKVLEALIETDAIPKRSSINGMDTMEALPQNGGGHSSTTPSSAANVMDPAKESAFSSCGIGYGDQRMWNAIQEVPELLNQVMAFYNEAETIYMRRGILPMLIEVQMKAIRMLLAFKGEDAKVRINNTVTRVLEVWPRLKFEFDRMNLVIEVSNILKALDLKRKRAFLIWQALDSVHLMQTSDVALISLALKSELCTDILELQRGVSYLTRDVFVTPHWPDLHKAMAEAILSTASKAGMEIIVWESAAMLLRDSYSYFTQERQQMLMDVLKRASSQLSITDKTRHNLGPPPFFQVRNICHLSDHLKPQICDELMDKSSGKEEGSESAFIFNPYAAKRKSDARNERQDMSRWVVGEECSLEVYISNPCSVQLKIDRLCLCIEETEGESSRAAPISVGVSLPPKTKPTRVSLALVPHVAGPLRVLGCHVTLYGITWLQRFVASLRRVPRSQGIRLVDPEWGTEKNMVVELDVLPSMPLLKWQFLKIDSQQTWPSTLEESSRPVGPVSSEKDKMLIVTVRAGQKLDFKLRITNVSRFPVMRAKLMTLSKEKANAGSETHLVLEADEATLQQKLPICSNGVLELPVRVVVSHKIPGIGSTSRKPISTEIRLLYGGQHLETPSNAVMFGRELNAPLSFHVLPSANIVTVQISQHYVPLYVCRSATKSILNKLLKPSSSHSESSMSDEQSLTRSSDSIEETSTSSLSRRPSLKDRLEDFRRRDGSVGRGSMEISRDVVYHFRSEAVLRATIANHDTQVLCVWVGEVPDRQSFHSQQWKPPPAPESHSVVPGQAVQVSCPIPAMSLAEMEAETTRIEALACQWMFSHLCGYWQSVVHQPTFTENDESPSHDPVFSLHPAYGSQGTVPIRREHISRILNPTLLTSFVPAYVTLSVRLAEPYTKGFIDLRETMPAVRDAGSIIEAPLLEDPTDAWSLPAPDYEAPPGKPTKRRSDIPSEPKGPNGEVWGIQTEIGEFLNCEALVENHRGSALENLTITLCSERIDEGGMHSDILFRRESGLNDAGILLTGQTSNIPVTTDAPHFHHKFGLCCVMPGLYQVYVCEKVPDGHETDLFVQGFKLNIICK